MSDEVLTRVSDLQDRMEHQETIDQPLPELIPVFTRFCALREYWAMSRKNSNNKTFLTTSILMIGPK